MGLSTRTVILAGRLVVRSSCSLSASQTLLHVLAELRLLFFEDNRDKADNTSLWISPPASQAIHKGQTTVLPHLLRKAYLPRSYKAACAISLQAAHVFNMWKELGLVSTAGLLDEENAEAQSDFLLSFSGLPE